MDSVKTREFRSDSDRRWVIEEGKPSEGEAKGERESESVKLRVRHVGRNPERATPSRAQFTVENIGLVIEYENVSKWRSGSMRMLHRGENIGLVMRMYPNITNCL
jgi:hypothetical protein